ncbi:hypothetical protein LB561_07460 [Mesorhizobium sp. B292B1B]|uniref:hypothetical protein n=1 Tax=unclassified Mesorhizobium TaxID=325217 RepID=UPI001CD062E2|nr:MULTISPECIES: hypothetical protein [unclassified Mesorhizobium]MCA0011300.1 hypothetical protein [Mesorhizobium sp. B294B1A1]MCA0037128.1 hypothetical protein [Mesorhizobium sp. B292B1B]
MPVLDEVRLTDADADALQELLQRHGNVRHIFIGHVHRLIAGNWRGIPVSTLRSFSRKAGVSATNRRLRRDLGRRG